MNDHEIQKGGLDRQTVIFGQLALEQRSSARRARQAEAARVYRDRRAEGVPLRPYVKQATSRDLDRDMECDSD